MLDQDLEEKAALYASGVMTAAERQHFELILEFHSEVRELVRQLEEVSATAVVTGLSNTTEVPPAKLKARIMAEIEKGRPQAHPSGFVVSAPDGLVRWVNPAFTEMCGYSVEELQGRKLGPLLQGELTDRHAARRMREAVHGLRTCTEELINYHKNGQPYWVAINIIPILNEQGEARWLVAHERELKDRPLVAA